MNFFYLFDKSKQWKFLSCFLFDEELADFAKFILQSGLETLIWIMLRLLTKRQGGGGYSIWLQSELFRSHWTWFCDEMTKSRFASGMLRSLVCQHLPPLPATLKVCHLNKKIIISIVAQGVWPCILWQERVNVPLIQATISPLMPVRLSFSLMSATDLSSIESGPVYKLQTIRDMCLIRPIPNLLNRSCDVWHHTESGSLFIF